MSERGFHIFPFPRPPRWKQKPFHALFLPILEELAQDSLGEQYADDIGASWFFGDLSATQYVHGLIDAWSGARQCSGAKEAWGDVPKYGAMIQSVPDEPFYWELCEWLCGRLSFCKLTKAGRESLYDVIGGDVKSENPANDWAAYFPGMFWDTDWLLPGLGQSKSVFPKWTPKDSSKGRLIGRVKKLSTTIQNHSAFSIHNQVYWRSEPKLKLEPEPKPKKKTAPKKPPKPGWVYLGRSKNHGRTKIGFTSKETPEFRTKTLQADDPEYYLVGAWKANSSVERLLHRRFKEKRVNGEWFALSRTDVKRISAELKAGNVMTANEAAKRYGEETLFHD